MMSTELTRFVAVYRQRVDQQLGGALPSQVPDGERLLECMKYALLRGGKRIRPLLAYASAQAAGGTMDSPALDAAACALECIHAYSLIHDDLPAMDDDDLRRGEPTCHIAFDEATAILAGDALQCLAFEILANCQAAPATVVALVQELSRAAGANGMVAGQAIDLALENTNSSLQQLARMHNHKTGALIEAAVAMGALAIGKSDSSQINALRSYAKAIGLSFQVQDDILDVTTTTEVLGKRQGADASRNKSTYVSLLGLEGARSKALQLHHSALEALEGFDGRADLLRDLSAYVIQRVN